MANTQDEHVNAKIEAMIKVARVLYDIDRAKGKTEMEAFDHALRTVLEGIFLAIQQLSEKARRGEL